MPDLLKESLWKQFGASIDMLQNAIQMWPEDEWYTDKRFFYNAYHCLIFLDYYQTVPAKPLVAPLPFTHAESGDTPPELIGDLVPDRIYSKEELLDYLQLLRDRLRVLIANLDEKKCKERWIEPWDTDAMDYPVLELLLYNMRHVQHHAAQLNMLLRQKINRTPGWRERAEDGLPAD